jgi:hypothetical protein
LPVVYKKDYILYDHAFLLNNLIYKDQTWNYVKQLDELFRKKRGWKKVIVSDNSCINNKITFLDDNTIYIKSYGINNDWIYWYINKNLPNRYLLNFKSQISTQFTEFQIAFKHKDISERYRFRVVNNLILTFEVVNHGYFFSNLISMPFSFELGKLYDIKLLIYDNQYSFLVNDEIIMSINDNINSCNGTGLSLIFWDNCEQSKIEIILKQLKLYTLQ